MSKKKEKSFLFETVSGKNDGNSGKRMRECRGSCGFLGALKSLLRHSITTGATSVTIRIDLEYPYLQIADNGVGISKSEIGEIGKTTFLDLITAAEEVLIETMTMSMEKSTVMKFRNKVLLVPKNTEVLKAGEETFDWLQPSSPSPWVAPKAISCTIESPRHQRHSVGTTFTLTNIQLSIMEKIEQLDKKIVNFVKHFAIVHYQMSITLKNIKGNKLIFGAKKTKSITERVTSIFNLADMEFNSIVKSSNNITIEAYWGTKLYHSSAIQFVFINGQPCSNIRLLKTIKKEWKCDTKKKYPVYVLCITIRAIANGNIDKISHDSVIKDCIRECVAKSGGFKEAGYISSDDDDLQTTMKSVYCRPQFFWETKQHKKKKSSLQNKEDLEIFKLPSPREIEENHKRPCETSILDKHTKTPEKSITNLTLLPQNRSLCPLKSSSINPYLLVTWKKKQKGFGTK
ncbi:uncharacterized protein LOC129809524 isoform X2 [Phlebotomus papatasi]|uniref:uncharacterized protein LOC129809524 isoform X2 n=1 Tax=Phlebotomus papatasi TaxID=29031 RepID=UPI00248469C9|nr:uncharacterized protein LOC129809524 isoform X2 [Phlebotomus papatasi]